MRRFSQRNSLVTLSDINITPLLDLAFVLLIIFIITTPLLEKGSVLQLPTDGGKADVNPSPRNTRTLDVTAQGVYLLDRKSMTPEMIARQLTADFRANPNLEVNLRVDRSAKMDFFTKAYTAIEDAGITHVNLRREAGNR